MRRKVVHHTMSKPTATAMTSAAAAAAAAAGVLLAATTACGWGFEGTTARRHPENPRCRRPRGTELGRRGTFCYRSVAATWPRRRIPILYCEGTDAPSSPLQPSISEEVLDDENFYLRMDLPSRALEPTHAIFGSPGGLLGDGRVESYRVYRRGTVGPGTSSGVVVEATVRLGGSLDGHRGVVHGGILALLVDDVLGFAYDALEIPLAVTANLTVNYLAAVPARSTIRIVATLVERTERKLIWNVRVSAASPTADVGDATVDADAALYCEATSVYVIPRDVYENMTER